MPVAWLGLALVVVVAVPAWWLARRARAAKHEHTHENAPPPGGSARGRPPAGAARSRTGAASPHDARTEAGVPHPQSAPDALSAVEVFRRLNELAFGVERLG